MDTTQATPEQLRRWAGYCREDAQRAQDSLPGTLPLARRLELSDYAVEMRKLAEWLEAYAVEAEARTSTCADCEAQATTERCGERLCHACAEQFDMSHDTLANMEARNG